MPMPFLEITSKRFSENSPWAPSGVYSVHSLYRPVFTLTPFVAMRRHSSFDVLIAILEWLELSIRPKLRWIGFWPCMHGFCA